MCIQSNPKQNKMTSVTLKFFDFKPDYENELKKVFDQTAFPIQNPQGISQLKVEMATENLFDLPEYADHTNHPQIAFVSPANSFGWMSGGIDYPLSAKVLPRIEKELQKMLTTLNYRGALERGYSKEFMDTMLDSVQTICTIDPVLQKKVLALLKAENPSVTADTMTDQITPEFLTKHFPRQTPELHLPVGSAILVYHQDKKQFLVSAPTMFFPQDVRGTRNAYFAMVAILKVVDKYNLANPTTPITRILCPGLCTGVGGLSFQTLSKLVHEAVLDFQKGIKDPDTLDQELVKKWENIHPNLLYLRESAFHQQPHKIGMLTHQLKSMLESDTNMIETNELLESEFEAKMFS